MSAESQHESSSARPAFEPGDLYRMCTVLLVAATFWVALYASSSYEPTRPLALVMAFGFSAVVCAILSIRERAEKR